MPTESTPTQRLAAALLNQSLDQFVADRRPRSWRLIARDLYEATGGQVDVTSQTLINWYGDAPARAAS